MSFFLPNRLTCIFCEKLIETRVQAAQLPFAHPDDVGDLARHGRAWVHRACWNESSLREAWSASALRLLTSDPANVSSDGVVCRSNADSILLLDPWQAVSVSIPCSNLAQVLSANEQGGEVSLRSALWTFVPDGEVIQIAGTQDGEPFESFRQARGRWSQVLSSALEGKSLAKAPS